MKEFKPFLMHIIDEINYLIRNSKDIEFCNFLDDETFERSFTRSLEIIGEATKNLPKDFRNKYPDIPWKKMAGLRDIITHYYFGVDYKKIWDIIKNEIPKLKSQIEKILFEIEKDKQPI
ncbi:MAG: DUF86 domain-containing protein [Nitrospirota bacterium]